VAGNTILAEISELIPVMMQSGHRLIAISNSQLSTAKAHPVVVLKARGLTSKRAALRCCPLKGNMPERSDERQVIPSSSTQKTLAIKFRARSHFRVKISVHASELADRSRIYSEQATTRRRFCGAQMLHDAPIAVRKAPHVVVVGNEKGVQVRRRSRCMLPSRSQQLRQLGDIRRNPVPPSSRGKSCLVISMKGLSWWP
jgi:hypothetical protein